MRYILLCLIGSLIGGCSSNITTISPAQPPNTAVTTGEKSVTLNPSLLTSSPYLSSNQKEPYLLESKINNNQTALTSTSVNSTVYQTGTASWYGPHFQGRKTANGEVFNMYKLTAAHRKLPLPSYVKVTNQNNGKSVIVRVNDRGPYHGKRIIDLSYAAAKQIGMLTTGTAPVSLQLVSPPITAP